VLLAKTLVAVAHPVDERDLGAFRASRSHRTQEHRRLRKRHTFTRVACLMAILLACCARSGPDQLGLSPVAFRDLPGWQADRVAEAMPALLKSCQHADTLSTGQSRGTVAAPGVDLAVFWPRVCTAARSVPADDEPAMRAFVERQFQPYAVSNNGHTDGVLTGYFEPEVEGARNANARMHAPLLARPTDLVEVDLGAFSADLAGRRIAGRMQDGSLVPYWDRAEIEAGALGNRAQPIVYLASPINVFFLQIQGSGRVRLRGGQVVRVGFAGRNGWPYVAIGKLLVDRGQLERTNVSMQSIRAWLEQHPAEAAGVMAENRSYVFFRELTGLGAKDRADRRTGRSLDPRALAGSRPRIHPARRARLGRHNGSTGRLADAAIDVGARHWRGDKRASPRGRVLWLGRRGRGPSRQDGTTRAAIRPAAPPCCEMSGYGMIGRERSANPAQGLFDRAIHDSA
jgi:membrane-bound lytic murein transglycosylase A